MFKLRPVFLILIILIFQTQQITNQPNYSSIYSFTIGKFDALTTLTAEQSAWKQFTVNFGKTLTNQAKKQAIVSLVSFDALTTNEFSFNTSTTSLTLSSLTLSVQVVGNSYFRLLSLQYMAVTYPSGTSYLLNNCFLSSELLTNASTATFQKVDLLSTETNRFQVTSSISGLRMYNNKEKIKGVHVDTEIRANSSLLNFVISRKGNTQIQWICLSTVLMDTQDKTLFSEESGVFLFGSAKVNHNDQNLNWPDVPETFDSVDQMYFGLSSIQLETGEQNWKFVMRSQRTVDFKLDSQIVSFSGTISYFFVAYHSCIDLATPYFNYMDNLCYDLCPSETFQQQIPVKNCYQCHQNCLTCSGKANNQCQTCESLDFRTINGSQCSCNVGYVDSGKPTCQKCQILMEYCLECSSTNICTQCAFGLIFDPTTEKCICSNGEYFVKKSSVCLPYPGCLQTINSGSSLICQPCDTAAYFQKTSDNLACSCQTYYEIFDDQCVPKCGDGINLIENDPKYCDDGNTLNNDGCNSNCQIETLFGCSNAVYGISVCSPLANLTVQHIYTERIPEQNSVVIGLKITPFMDIFSSQNFNFFINASIPYEYVQFEVNQEHQILEVVFAYTETIEQTNHSILIGFDKAQVSAPQQNIQIQLKGTNLKLTYDSNIQLRKILKLFNIIVVCLILAVFLVFCMLVQKMAGTQLLLSTHFIFLSIFSAGNNAAIHGLSTLKYLFGFNDLGSFSISYENFEILTILPLKTFKQFLLNFNFMIGLQVLSIIIFIPFKIKLWRLQSIKEKLLNYQILISPLGKNEQFPEEQPITVTQIRKQIYQVSIMVKKYLNRFYYPISLICLLPSVFYFCVQVYSVNINNQYELNPIWNIGSSIVSLFMSLVFVVFLYNQSQKNKAIFTFFRKAILYPFFLVFLYLIGTLAYSVSMGYDFSFYVIFAFEIGILAFRIIVKPYPKATSIQSIDSLIKHLITIVCMSILFASRFMTQSCQMMFFAIPVLLLVSVGLTLGRYLKTFVGRKRKTSTQVDLLPNGNNDSDKNLQDKSEHDDQESEQEEDEEDSQQRSSQNSKDKFLQAHEELQKDEQQISIEPISKLQKTSQMTKSIGFQEPEAEDEDQLTRVKRKLRSDLKQRRGLINSFAAKFKNKKII